MQEWAGVHPCFIERDAPKAEIAELLAWDAEAPAEVVIDHLRLQGYREDHGPHGLLQRARCEFLLAQGRHRTSYLPGEIAHGDWWEPPLVIPVGRTGRARSTASLPHCSAHAAVFSFLKRTPEFLERGGSMRAYVEHVLEREVEQPPERGRPP